MRPRFVSMHRIQATRGQRARQPQVGGEGGRCLFALCPCTRDGPPEAKGLDIPRWWGGGGGDEGGGEVVMP